MKRVTAFDLDVYARNAEKLSLRGIIKKRVEDRNGVTLYGNFEIKRGGETYVSEYLGMSIQLISALNLDTSGPHIGVELL